MFPQQLLENDWKDLETKSHWDFDIRCLTVCLFVSLLRHRFAYIHDMHIFTVYCVLLWACGLVGWVKKRCKNKKYGTILLVLCLWIHFLLRKFKKVFTVYLMTLSLTLIWLQVWDSDTVLGLDRTESGSQTWIVVWTGCNSGCSCSLSLFIYLVC